MIAFLTDSTSYLRRLLVNRGASLGTYKAYELPDTERVYQLTENVKRKQTAIIASVFPNPESLFDLLAVHRTIRDQGALPPMIVIPYLGYARQDGTLPDGGSLGLLVAELIRNLNPRQIIVLDIHSQTILEALGPRAASISALSLFARAFDKGKPVEVIIAPHGGAEHRAKALAHLMGDIPDVVCLKQEQTSDAHTIAKSIHDKLKGKHVVLLDDMIDTGATMIEAVRFVAKEGASSIRIAATHGIFSKTAKEKLLKLPVEKIYVTNSLPQERDERIDILDMTPLLMHSLQS